jgi:NADPH-dependent 2,4-dienoyl-CoA reductase/sulfur reductase-like enzyme
MAAGSAAAVTGWLGACGGDDAGSDDAAAAVDADGLEKDSSRSGSTNPVPAAGVSGRVVVVGGGMAGVTAAKYLRLWGGRPLAVTLVERESAYTSCILSSLVLTGQRTIDSLRYSYAQLRMRYGVNVVAGEVASVVPGRVTLTNGTTLDADRIVLAPGIDFEPVPGLTDPNAMPHAWRAGTQTTALAQQMKAMPSGGTMVLTIPATPYRCPPGPYERACLIADWMKVNKPGSKLIVLDANPDFVTEKDNFGQAFFGLHANVIDYRTSLSVTSVDQASTTLNLSDGTSLRADVVNLIPRQTAPRIIHDAGLANGQGGRFAAVDVLTYESTAVPGIHVIGDASATTQPKAGHIANQEAKVCADAIVRALGGLAPDPAPVTNSSCYSTITMKQASWLHAVFQYDAATRSMASVAAASGASAGWTSGDFEDMNKWFTALMADTFA